MPFVYVKEPEVRGEQEVLMADLKPIKQLGIQWYVEKRERLVKCCCCLAKLLKQRRYDVDLLSVMGEKSCS